MLNTKFNDFRMRLYSVLFRILNRKSMIWCAKHVFGVKDIEKRLIMIAWLIDYYFYLKDYEVEEDLDEVARMIEI